MTSKSASISWTARVVTRTEGVGELGDGEDAFATECLALLRAHAGQETQIVLLNCDLPATGLKFAFGAMTVQDKLGRRGACKQCDESLDAFPHFVGQGRRLHNECGVVVAVNDFAEANFAP